MAVPARLAQDWKRWVGRDAAHSGRRIRALQIAGQVETGKTGKAAHLSSTSLTNFLLADATGDAINTSAEQVTLWRSLVRDRTQSPIIVDSRSEADKAFRARFDFMRTAEELDDPHAKHDILIGPNLGAGIDAMLEGLSNLEFDIPLSYAGEPFAGTAPFAQIVSHMQFKIELHIGGNEGPLALVRTMNRQDRYSIPGWPVTKRFPVVSVATLEFPHFNILSHLLADTKAQTSILQPVPPSVPASPAGSGSGNAGTVPTAPASSDYQPHDDAQVDTGTPREISKLRGTDHNPRVCVSSTRIGSEVGTPSNRRRRDDPTSHHHALL